MISSADAVCIEPALAHMRLQMAGAAYTVEEGSGDAYRFARELAMSYEKAGVKFLMSHTVTALREIGGLMRRNLTTFSSTSATVI